MVPSHDLLELHTKFTGNTEEGPSLCPPVPPRRAAHLQHCTPALVTLLLLLHWQSHHAHEQLTAIPECHSPNGSLIYSTMTLLLNSFPSWILLLQQKLPLTWKGQKEPSGAAHEQSNVPGAPRGSSSADSPPDSFIPDMSTLYVTPEAPCLPSD